MQCLIFYTLPHQTELTQEELVSLKIYIKTTKKKTHLTLGLAFQEELWCNHLVTQGSSVNLIVSQFYQFPKT